ncbi:hypothetical protein OSTOST_03106 [Ostertagia ostertagi]
MACSLRACWEQTISGGNPQDARLNTTGARIVCGMSRVADTTQRGGPHSRSVVPLSAGQRASQLPSLGQSPLRGVTNPKERNAQGATVTSRRSSLWFTNELNKLADLVNRHRDASGRIQWRNLGPAWESLRNENDPQRTIAALKGAYAKLAWGTGRTTNENAIRAQRAEMAKPSENAGRQFEQNGHNGLMQEGTEDAREERMLGPSRSSAQEPRERAVPKILPYSDLNSRSAADKKTKGRNSKGLARRIEANISNAAVYAIARVISAKAVEEASKRLGPERKRFNEATQLRSTLIRFISALAGELRGRRIEAPSETPRSVKRRTARHQEDGRCQEALPTREPRDQGGNVPVSQVREYGAPIVGKVQPFLETVELATWSRTHRRTANTHVDVDLSEDDWRTLFSKERLKEWCMKALHICREAIPRWLCRGKVVLIPKGKSAVPGPGDFRPIACFNTCYKVLTAMIANRIAACTQVRFPKEQVALRRGRTKVRGSKAIRYRPSSDRKLCHLAIRWGIVALSRSFPETKVFRFLG